MFLKNKGVWQNLDNTLKIWKITCNIEKSLVVYFRENLIGDYFKNIFRENIFT